MAGIVGIPYPWERAVFSAGFLVNLDCATIYQAVFGNRQYEGELRQAGSVMVPLIGNVTITEYKGPWPSSEWETLKASYAMLAIDKARKFLVKIPDVRQQFTGMNLLSVAANRAAVAIGQTIDRNVAIAATAEVTDGGPQLRIGPYEIDIDMAPSTFIMLLREKLVDACAPMNSLRCVVPSWFASRLLLELGYRATGAGEEFFAQGPGAVGPTDVEFPRPAAGSFVAMVYGVQVYQSAAVPMNAAGNSIIVMGDPLISFAGAIENVETLRIENDFAWGTKGLFVYGTGLLQPETMAIGTAFAGPTPFMAPAAYAASRSGGGGALPSPRAERPITEPPARPTADQPRRERPSS